MVTALWSTITRILSYLHSWWSWVAALPGAFIAWCKQLTTAVISAVQPQPKLGLLGALVPGASLLSPLVTWLVASGSIVAIVSGLFLYARHEGVAMQQAADAKDRQTLNAIIADLNAQLQAAHIQAVQHLPQTVAVAEAPHPPCVASQDIADKLMGVH